jgi:hypothetical protein
MGNPTRLDIRHIRNHALRAIGQRLGPGGTPADHCILAVERDGDDVIVRVNSGGNALAVEPYLNRQGYRAEFAGTNPGGYGCAVRVGLRRSEIAHDVFVSAHWHNDNTVGLEVECACGDTLLAASDYQPFLGAEEISVARQSHLVAAASLLAAKEGDQR